MGARFAEQERELRSNQVVCMVPPSENLWNQDEFSRLWPEIYKNGLFSEQLKNLQENSLNINVVLDKLPIGKEISEVINEGVITEFEAINFYKSLDSLLKNEDYRRLVLYLPFEIIPSVEWKSNNQKLSQFINEFRNDYLGAWVNLLSTQDVRANFVDGDVIEFDVRQSDPQRVVKAAHLIPELIKKGLLNKKQILGLASEVSDPVLKRSINDVLPVMRNLDQITSDEFDQNYELMADENKLSSEPATKERRKWLIKKQRESEIMEKAEIISEQLLLGIALDSSLDKEVVVEAIRTAVEKAGSEDLSQAQKILEQYKETLLASPNGNNDLKERLIKTWRHFYRLGLTDKKRLEQLEIKLSDLSSKFSENLPNLSTEIEKLKGILMEIKLDSELERSVLPVILVGGSKVKGYDELISDTDISIFIKPGTSESRKTQIREKLLRVFLKNNFDHKPTEFWLIKQGDRLKIDDDLKKDRWMAESDWVHVLLNSFWLGDKSEVNKLRNRLLPSFFEMTNETKHHHPIRELYFENMEKDLLQYRLMHKGYERNFPIIQNPYKDESSIDGTSAFWDSGYRQLATRLFVNNIFLPKLES